MDLTLTRAMQNAAVKLTAPGLHTRNNCRRVLLISTLLLSRPSAVICIKKHVRSFFEIVIHIPRSRRFAPLLEQSLSSGRQRKPCPGFQSSIVRTANQIARKIRYGKLNTTGYGKTCIGVSPIMHFMDLSHARSHPEQSPLRFAPFDLVEAGIGAQWIKPLWAFQDVGIQRCQVRLHCLREDRESSVHRTWTPI